MKGSAITGPVGKEAAELWPVSTTPSTSILVLRNANISGTAYRLQLWCRDVSGCLLRETVHMGGVRAAFHAQASSMISCLKTHPLNQLFQPKTSATTFEHLEDPRRLRHLQNATRYPASYNNLRFPVVLWSTDVNTPTCATYQLELLEIVVMYAPMVRFSLTSSSDQDNLLLCDWNCEPGKLRTRNCQEYSHCLEPETPQLALDHFSPGRDGLSSLRQPRSTP
jgi:hypothetical protein